MLIKMVRPTKDVEVFLIDFETYSFSKKNDYTVEIPDTKEGCGDEPSEEVRWFLLNPNNRGLFVKVEGAPTKRAKEEKKEGPAKAKAPTPRAKVRKGTKKRKAK